MKKILPILIVLILCSLASIAQIVPAGMKYQAVARDLNGQILSDKSISLQIALFTKGKTKDYPYTEEHQVLTNQFGLFTLTIGAGKKIQGAFDQIPWSAEEVWMELSIDDQGGKDFVLVHSSRLLAVPYAFHAATANTLIDNGGVKAGPGPGVPSQNWSLFGNSTSDPSIDKLGTTDLADLVLVTDNIERMRILEDGDVQIVKSASVGDNLTVEDNVYLNTVVGGETINNGPLTVANQSPTLLTGTLTVDEETDLNSSLNVDGVTNLNSDFFVNNESPSKLSGTLTVDQETDLNSSLNVDGVTDLNSDLNVNNESPTSLSGTLLVEKDATFNEHVTLDNAALESTSSSDGALVVAGGVGIGENLNVKNNLKIEGPTPNNPLAPNGDKFTVTVDEAKFGVPVKFSSKTTFEAPVEINNEATPITETALIVKANVAAGADNRTPTHHVAHFENLADGNGISIRVNNANPENKNNFITFYGTGTDMTTNTSDYGPNRPIRGRIEGEWTDNDLSNNREYQNDDDFLIAGVTLATLDAAIAFAESIQAGIAATAAATSTTACVGLGACVTAPIPSLVVASTAEVILDAATVLSAAGSLAEASANLEVFRETHRDLLGITFASGSEDYAEYLPKLNLEDHFLPGDIVGIKNGYVTKNTSDADKIMVVSFKPIIAGGLPTDADVSAYSLVAFMGQVNVKVMGQVKPGDYILPAGYDKGIGIAKSPGVMKPKDYKNILGVAWEIKEDKNIGYVNTAIGLNTNDLADLVQQQAIKMEEQETRILLLEEQIARTNTTLADLVPGYAEALNLEKSKPVTVDNSKIDNSTQNKVDQESFIEIESDQIVYFKIERKYIEEGFKLAEQATLESFAKANLDINLNPFWNRIYTEPGFKDELLNDIAKKLENSLHTHQKINERVLENE